MIEICAAVIPRPRKAPAGTIKAAKPMVEDAIDAIGMDAAVEARKSFTSTKIT